MRKEGCNGVVILYCRSRNNDFVLYISEQSDRDDAASSRHMVSSRGRVETRF